MRVDCNSYRKASSRPDSADLKHDFWKEDLSLKSPDKQKLKDFLKEEGFNQ